MKVYTGKHLITRLLVFTSNTATMYLKSRQIVYMYLFIYAILEIVYVYKWFFKSI